MGNFTAARAAAEELKKEIASAPVISKRLNLHLNMGKKGHCTVHSIFRNGVITGITLNEKTEGGKFTERLLTAPGHHCLNLLDPDQARNMLEWIERVCVGENLTPDPYTPKEA